MIISANDKLLLPRLLVGLEEMRQQFDDGKPPIPSSTLQVAWNALAAAWINQEKQTYPMTMQALLSICSKPIGEWFPGSLPDNIPTSDRLLYPGQDLELTEWANYYLTEELQRSEEIVNLTNAGKVERHLQNLQFVNLLHTLKSARDRVRAQADYVKFRRYLIGHPYTTRQHISDIFALSSIHADKAGDMYVDCSRGETYYLCPNCGPLLQKHGRLRGAKPDVCSDHREGPNGNIISVPYVHGLCRLKTAIFERVCLHGITEIKWLDSVRELIGVGRNAIVSVEDWPGIDAYDLRIKFKDGAVWAADLKDYFYPEQLANALKEFSVSREGLSFNTAFYVIPDRRVDANRNYISQLVSYKLLSDAYRILTISDFMSELSKYARRVKRKGDSL